MALSLSLSSAQSNDAVTWTLTDTAGTYHAVDNTDGWGAPNEVVTNIVAEATTTVGKRHLTLDLTVTDKNGDATTYDQINLYDHNGSAFTDTGDLVFEFNPDDFEESSTAMGAATDKFDDGVYVVTYTLAQADDGTVLHTLTDGFVIDGDVKIDLYNALRNVPTSYDNNENNESRDIMEALLAKSYYDGIHSYTTPESDTEEISNMLYTLDSILSDGSKYQW